MATVNRSAEIIAFPLRGRFVAVRQDDSDPHAAARAVQAAVSGSSWYHEEAVREERTRSN